MNNKSKNNIPFSFSKVIYGINILFVMLVVTVSFIIVIFSGRLGITDLSPISIICTSAFTSLSAASIFYYRKAQSENVLKISRQIQKENLDIQNIEAANQVMNSNFNNNGF